MQPPFGAALSRICLRTPRRYLTPARCALMREAAIDFCDLLGAEAHALGWTAAELFALHPEYGTVRIEVCWVMISGNRAHAVELSRVGFSVVRPTAPSRVRSEVSRSGRSLRARAAQPCTRIGSIRARSRIYGPSRDPPPLLRGTRQRLQRTQDLARSSFKRRPHGR